MYTRQLYEQLIVEYCDASRSRQLHKEQRGNSEAVVLALHRGRSLTHRSNPFIH